MARGLTVSKFGSGKSSEAGQITKVTNL